MTDDVSLAGLAVRLIGSLALVVGLMLLIARFANRRLQTPVGAAIQVVHRQALGRGTGVAVVSVGTRVLVLGTTEQQVTLLAEVEPDEVGLEIDDAVPGTLLAPTAAGGPERAAVRLPTLPGTLTGPLAGSVLSPQTWKQTLAAFTGRTGAAAEPSPEEPERRAS